MTYTLEVKIQLAISFAIFSVEVFLTDILSEAKLVAVIACLVSWFFAIRWVQRKQERQKAELAIIEMAKNEPIGKWPGMGVEMFYQCIDEAVSSGSIEVIDPETIDYWIESKVFSECSSLDSYMKWANVRPNIVEKYSYLPHEKPPTVAMAWDGHPAIQLEGGYVLPRKAEMIINSEYYPTGTIGEWPVCPETKEKLKIAKPWPTTKDYLKFDRSASR